MDFTLVTLAEQLAAEFSHRPSTVVIQVVTDCVDEFPNVDGQFIEQAARAHLSAVLSLPDSGRFS